MPDKSSQTEQATPRRLEKAREEGRFPVCREFVSAVQFLVFTGLLAFFGREVFGRLARTSASLFVGAFKIELTRETTIGLVHNLLHDLTPLASFGGILLGVTLGMQLVTTRFGLSGARLKPDFSKLNPLSKLRELPRQNIPQFVQALVLLPLFGWILWGLARSLLPALLQMPLQSIRAGTTALADALQSLLWKGAVVFLAWGSIDLFRQQRRYMADMRMSKQEVRDEYKEVEGNPQMKARVRRLQREMSRRKMMQDVPTATAVVVNPTHFAVAIRYEMDSMAAPVVVAKGKNYLALRIRKRALEHQIPIVENPPLAQALYKATVVGQEIPPQLYQAVAEILAYIYRLMHGSRGR